MSQDPAGRGDTPLIHVTADNPAGIVAESVTTVDVCPACGAPTPVPPVTLEEWQTHLIELWAEGKPAPYDLYDAPDLINGGMTIVEATGDTALAPFIRRGDIIATFAAAKVARHVRPIIPDPTELEQTHTGLPSCACSEDGTLPDECWDGEPYTVTVTGQSRPPVLLSRSGTPVIGRRR